MKIALKIFLGIFTLVLVAVAGFAFTFNPNDYKDEIIELVKENTGRQLHIPGDISLSLFPWLGIELGKIEISNAKGFAKKPFAKMNRLQVRAKLWPLFQQRLEADTLIIQGLTLNLAKNKKGESNWADLLQKKKKTKKPSNRKTKTQEKKSSKANLLAAFAIHGIKIQQAQFNWHDQQQNQKTAIKNIQLDIGRLKPNTPIPFSIELEAQQADLNAKLNIKNKITFSPDFKKFSLLDTTLQSKIKLAAIKKTQTLALESKLITLNLNNQVAKSKNVKLAINKIKLNAYFEAKNILSSPRVNARLDVATFNPRDIIKELDIVLPDMSDKKALTKFNAKLEVFTTLQKIALSDIKITLDDTKINGQAVIRLPSASVVHLDINEINLDRYLPTPVKKSTAKKEEVITPNKALETALIPIALLTQLELAADIKINKLQIKKTHWKNLQVTLNAKQGNVNINPISLQGYGSTINSDVNIKAIDNSATLAANLSIKDIRAGEILKDFMAVKKLQGLTSINANISTQGVKLTQLKQNLNGKMRFNLRDGIIKGIDLEYEIDKLEAKIKRKPAPTTPSPLQTKFTNLSANALIKNGVVHNKDLRAATPFTRIIGQGSINLPKETLNYVATVKLTNARDLKDNRPFEKMNSIPLDIHILGTFAKPQIKTNFSKALKTRLKQEAKKNKLKLKKKLKEKYKKKKLIIKEKTKKELKKKLKDKLNKYFQF